MFEPGEELIENSTLRERVYCRRHQSGLAVYFCPRPGFNKRYACYATDFGSIDSAFALPGQERFEVPDGVAHFLEHKMFEQPDGSDAFGAFSALGASPNAYTSAATTNYLFSCSDSFYQNLQLLVDMVQNSHFTDENIEKEKGIIGEEIHMYEDSPGFRSYMNLLQALYQVDSSKIPILGTVESIGTITKPILDRCYETFYHPENMVLFAIGDLNKDEFFEQADKALSKRSYSPLGKIERFTPTEPAAVAQQRIEDQMVLSLPRVLLGFKDLNNGFGGRELLAKEQATDILLEIVFGKGSDLFEGLYSEQLIDEGFGCYYSGRSTAGFSLVGGESKDPDRLVERLFDQLDRIRSQGIAVEDFERQKRASMGHFLRQFNSLEFIANNFCGYRFQGVDLFDVIDVLHSLQLSDLEERLNEHLVRESAAVSVLQPRS